MGRGDDNLLFRPIKIKKLGDDTARESGFPGEVLTDREREEMLFPIIWEASEEIDGKHQRISLGGLNMQRESCTRIAHVLAQGEIADQVEEIYAAWEKKALQSKLYQKILKGKDMESRKDLLRKWGSLLASPSRGNRRFAIKQHMPYLLEEDREELVDSLPNPYRLRVVGDSPIRKCLEDGDWDLAEVPFFPDAV